MSIVSGRLHRIGMHVCPTRQSCAATEDRQLVTTVHGREPRWLHEHAVTTLTTTTLGQLLDGVIPGIHLRGFASPGECAAFCAAVDEATRGAAWASSKTSVYTNIGANLSNADTSTISGRLAYFDSVAEQEEIRSAIATASSFDARARVISALQRCWPHGSVDVAVEARLGRRYYAAGIKSRVAEAAPHFDFAPLLTGLPPDRVGDKGQSADADADVVPLEVSQIREQLSWNIYTAMPAATGQTTIYNASAVSVGPRPAGENPTGVPVEQLAGLPVCVVRPVVGDLLIMRTRAPHRVVVDATALHKGERRMQIGSFVGRTAENNLILWS